MGRYVHRPVEIEAVRWGGDLVDIRWFILGSEEAERDSRSGVLWITQRGRRGLETFPVPMGHWLARVDQRLVGMSPAEFDARYAIVAA